LDAMVFIQVVHGHPGTSLQLSGGGSKMTWLASAVSSIYARCPKKDGTETCKLVYTDVLMNCVCSQKLDRSDILCWSKLPAAKRQLSFTAA